MNKRRKLISGVSAIEFAMVFPVLFIILYGILTYSLIFAFQHSLSLAAAEGGRAAIRYQTNSDRVEDRIDAACLQMKKSLYLLEKIGIDTECSDAIEGAGGGAFSIKAGEVICPVSGENSSLKCMDISLEYDYKNFPILPTIPYLLPTPENIFAQSLTQFTLTY